MGNGKPRAHQRGSGLPTIMRHVAGLIAAISLAGPGSLWGQSPGCSPAAVTADPSSVDTAFPPVMRPVRIASGGVSLNGVLYLAQGPGPHPTVVFLHGFPGDEKNLDLAQVAAVAALAPVDLGTRGMAMSDSVVFAKEVQRREAQLSALRGTSGEVLSREALRRALEWSLQRHAAVLAKKPVRLLAATHDEAVPLSEVYEPLGARLRAAGARQLTSLTLESDHLFSDRRIALAQTLIRWLCGG